MDDRQPGLPTAKRVRAHAERWPYDGGGLWRVVSADGEVFLARLGVEGMDAYGWRHLFRRETAESLTWHPCTPDGDPVHLVELTWLLGRCQRCFADAPTGDIGKICGYCGAGDIVHVNDAGIINLRNERDEAHGQLIKLNGEMAAERAAHARTQGEVTLAQEACSDVLRQSKAEIAHLRAQLTAARDTYAQRVGEIRSEANAEIERLRASHAWALEAGMQIAIVAELQRQCDEWRERWKEEQAMRIAISDHDESMEMAESEMGRLQCVVALRTLGANLAMAGLCAELSRRSDLYEIRSAGDRAWITSCLRERGVL